MFRYFKDSSSKIFKRLGTEQLHTIRNLLGTTKLRKKVLKSRISIGPENLTLLYLILRLRAKEGPCVRKSSSSSATPDLVPAKVPSSRYHNWKEISEGTSIGSIKSHTTRKKARVLRDHLVVHTSLIHWKAKGPSWRLDGYWYTTLPKNIFQESDAEADEENWPTDPHWKLCTSQDCNVDKIKRNE